METSVWLSSWIAGNSVWKRTKLLNRIMYWGPVCFIGIVVILHVPPCMFGLCEQIQSTPNTLLYSFNYPGGSTTTNWWGCQRVCLMLPPKSIDCKSVRTWMLVFPHMHKPCMVYDKNQQAKICWNLGSNDNSFCLGLIILCVYVMISPVRERYCLQFECALTSFLALTVLPGAFCGTASKSLFPPLQGRNYHRGRGGCRPPAFLAMAENWKLLLIADWPTNVSTAPPRFSGNG